MALRLNAAHGRSTAPRVAPRRARRRGTPLPDPIRGAAEALFGVDFADVRIFVGGEAPRMGALAFTSGSHIYFAPGLYAPDTDEGLRLLGHELAHVVQQREGRAANALGYGVAVVRDAALEAEADRMGARLADMLVDRRPAVDGRSPLQLMKRTRKKEAGRLPYIVVIDDEGKVRQLLHADKDLTFYTTEKDLESDGYVVTRKGKTYSVAFIDDSGKRWPLSRVEVLQLRELGVIVLDEWLRYQRTDKEDEAS